MKLGAGRCIVQKISAEFEFGVIPLLGAHCQNVVLGYDIGKISAGCLVSKLFRTLMRLMNILQRVRCG